MAVTSQQVPKDCRLDLWCRIFSLVVRQFIPCVYVPLSEVKWRRHKLSKRCKSHSQWCRFLWHNTITPEIKYLRSTHFHITHQRRHRLSLKRFGVDRSCLQSSQDFDNMTHVTVPVAHGTPTSHLTFSYSGGERSKKFCDSSLLEIRGFWDVGLCPGQAASKGRSAFRMCAPRRVTDRPSLHLHSHSTDNPQLFLELFLWLP